MRVRYPALAKALGLAALALAACGGGDDGAGPTPDANVPPDAGPPPDAAFAACEEFVTAAAAVPVTEAGSLRGADIQAPDGCADVDAPFGIETPGADAVTRIDGLTVGHDYVVKVDGGDDISFYVVTGCSTSSGPAGNECLMFRDAQFDDHEQGRFTATTTSAFVVVDYFESTPPASSAYTVQVYQVDCESSAACAGATPACVDNRCVQCESDFQCHDAAHPVCSGTTQTCVAGIDQCSSDDAHEPNDDGPAGATPLVLDGGGHATLAGQICATPLTEADDASFTVATNGETWELRLDWASGDDLDLAVFDAAGNQLGVSFWEKPERIRLTDLAAGTYVVQLQEFAISADPAPVAYTLTATRESTVGCDDDGDCDDEFRNQLFRGTCSDGACVAIAGGGALAEGATCDSADDCGPGLACPAFPFTANAATRATCEPTCGDDDDCAALGSGFVCTTYLIDDQCVAKCTSDDQCPVLVNEQPDQPPWQRLRCQVATGRCLP